MLDIVKAPNPILSGNSKLVVKVDKAVVNLIEEMKISLAAAFDPVGVGLAAPQVGKPLRIFIAKPMPKSKISVFINPVITKEENFQEKDNEKTTKLEGCLSLPNIWGEVQRYSQIHVDFMDANGRKHSQKFSGFMAVVIQHEVDHLDGILFPKRVLEQKGTLYESKKDAKGEDIFEELKI
jgi:peptide deformylase